MKPLIIYLLTIKALGLLLMLIDKRKAQKKRWRIPEAVLLGVAIFGGSLGSLWGMHIAHHKTRKPLFFLGIPVIIFIQIMLICVSL